MAPESVRAAQSAMSAPRRWASIASDAIVDPAGRAQRGQLAEAVPADQVGADAEILEDPQQSQADRADRRLGEPRVAQGGSCAPAGSSSSNAGGG